MYIQINVYVYTFKCVLYIYEDISQVGTFASSLGVFLVHSLNFLRFNAFFALPLVFAALIAFMHDGNKWKPIQGFYCILTRAEWFRRAAIYRYNRVPPQNNSCELYENCGDILGTLFNHCFLFFLFPFLYFFTPFSQTFIPHVS